MGLIPCRGDWKYRTLDSNSTATFVQGSLTALDPARRVIEYSSVKSAALGIAMHNSAVSDANPGKVIVAVPAGEECTFLAQTGTLATSALSYGQACGISKSGNTVDQLDTTINSRISVIGTIYGKPLTISGVTYVEVAWSPTMGVWFSGSSNTFAS